MDIQPPADMKVYLADSPMDIRSPGHAGIHGYTDTRENESKSDSVTHGHLVIGGHQVTRGQIIHASQQRLFLLHTVSRNSAKP